MATKLKIGGVYEANSVFSGKRYVIKITSCHNGAYHYIVLGYNPERKYETFHSYSLFAERLKLLYVDKSGLAEVIYG
jgi:hypothetical protein